MKKALALVALVIVFVVHRRHQRRTGSNAA